MSDEYMAVLFEDMNGKLDALLEGQSTMATSRQLQAVDDRLRNVEADVKVIKAVVTDQSRVLNNHENRLVRLENWSPPPRAN